MEVTNLGDEYPAGDTDAKTAGPKSRPVTYCKELPWSRPRGKRWEASAPCSRAWPASNALQARGPWQVARVRDASSDPAGIQPSLASMVTEVFREKSSIAA